MTLRGIRSVGAYLPRLRIPRSRIVDQVSWTNPGLKSMARGARAFCNWDEDSITLAVQAARNAGTSLSDVSRLTLASTTLPFADRSNAGVVAEALAGTSENASTLATSDLTGSQRAGTSALLQAVTGQEDCLVVAADQRHTKPASMQELLYGHGAAAIEVGKDNLIARCLGAVSLNADLVDHYRAADADFDYGLESRWVRDEGYYKLIPEAIKALFDQTGVTSDQISAAAITIPDSAARGLCRRLVLPFAADPLQPDCGDTGAPQPLLRLIDCLSRSQVDDLVLLVGFGQGVDAFLFQQLKTMPENPVTHQLNAGVEQDNYVRFLSYGGGVDIDWGMRAERDNRTALSTFYRKKRDITGFVGGRCEDCGTPQFPKSKICVNCGAVGSQTDYGFAHRRGHVKSYTEDWLGYSPGPPLTYGNVAFEGGGNVYMEFTDLEPGEVEVGAPLHMVFRIKDFDRLRQFRRYFWKPTLVR